MTVHVLHFIGSCGSVVLGVYQSKDRAEEMMAFAKENMPIYQYLITECVLN